jgi:hypothetical protein
MGPICPNCNSSDYYEVMVVVKNDEETVLRDGAGFCNECGCLQEFYMPDVAHQ